MKKILNVTCFTLLFNFGVGQNLVPNPSFELSYPEPSKRLGDSNNFTCVDWIHSGNANYFKTARVGAYSISSDLFGPQIPFEGNAYVGMLLHGGSVLTSQYLQIKLLEKLKKGKYYCFKLHISLAENSSYCINEIDFCLSQDKIPVSLAGFLKINNYNKMVNDAFYKEKVNWMPLCFVYKAKGIEQFLTIGSLNEKIKSLDLLDKFAFRKVQGAFYFFDEICLIEVENPDSCECIINRNFEEAFNKPMALTNVSFESNKAELNSNSFVELDSLTAYLIKEPNYKIDILGHTDNSGTEEANQILSEARAKAVATYLIKHGIDAAKINWIGYGSTKPKEINESKENKLKNRRVEIKISLIK